MDEKLKLKKLIIAEVEGLTTEEEKKIVQKVLKNNKELKKFHDNLLNDVSDNQRPAINSDLKDKSSDEEEVQESEKFSPAQDLLSFLQLKDTFQEFLDKKLPFDPERQKRIITLWSIGTFLALFTGIFLVYKINQQTIHIKKASKVVDEAKDDINKFLDKRITHDKDTGDGAAVDAAGKVQNNFAEDPGKRTSVKTIKAASSQSMTENDIDVRTLQLLQQQQRLQRKNKIQFKEIEMKLEPFRRYQE